MFRSLIPLLVILVALICAAQCKAQCPGGFCRPAPSAPKATGQKPKGCDCCPRCECTGKCPCIISQGIAPAPRAKIIVFLPAIAVGQSIEIPCGLIYLPHCPPRHPRR